MSNIKDLENRLDVAEELQNYYHNLLLDYATLVGGIKGLVIGYEIQGMRLFPPEKALREIKEMIDKFDKKEGSHEPR